MQAIRVHSFGAPETLALDELPQPVPKDDEALIAVAYAGVNFYDTQLRAGMLPRPLPLTMGLEGAGTVLAAGPRAGVTAGARVAWAQSPGAYATHAVVPGQRLVPLPDGLSLADAAAVLFQGLTAHHLACATYPLHAGDTAFVHSAAGGVGGLLCQIAKLRGARAIGAVSSPAKAGIARENGADPVLVYGRDDLAAQTRDATDGRGANVVYDAVGLETFATSLDLLRPRGYLVIYGEASGFVPPVDVRELSAHGSLYLTRTSLGSYTASREELLERAGDLFGWVLDGSLRVRIHATYPLAEAAAAHRALEGRETTGKLLLRCG